MSQEAWIHILPALLAAAAIALAIALLWVYCLRQAVLHWRARFRVIERSMRARALMEPVLARLPRHAERHRLVGVIVELRCHHNLLPVVRKVREIVPGMPIRVFHGNVNRQFVQQGFAAEIAAGEIALVDLGIDHFSVECHNWLMTSERFYEACDARHILVFQTDSVLFARSRVRLDEFLGYDYVGARWHVGGEWPFRHWSLHPLPAIGKVGNGGLSLRRRQKMIEAVRAVPYLSTPFVAEDVYFAHALAQVGARLPSLEQCDRFSFEEVLGNELPFGAHKFLPPRFRDQILADERAILEDYSRPARSPSAGAGA